MAIREAEPRERGGGERRNGGGGRGRRGGGRIRIRAEEDGEALEAGQDFPCPADQEGHHHSPSLTSSRFTHREISGKQVRSDLL